MGSFRLRLTVLFGVVLLGFSVVAAHLARDELKRVLGAKLERRGVAIARDLAAGCEDSLLTGDRFAVMDLVSRTKANNPDARYIFICDEDGRVVANTFGNRLPRGLDVANRIEGAQPWQVRRFKTDAGLIRDVAVPIPGTRNGSVRVGMADESFAATLVAFSQTLAIAAGSVLLAGLLVSYGLAGFLTRPLIRLVQAVGSVERGNLRERIPSPGSDEVGQLASAFNKMTQALSEKEAIRQGLLEKVITSQEEERKRIARDLHDELAQQLAYVLLRLEDLETRPESMAPESRQILAGARQAVSASLAGTRRLIGDLRPSVLDDLGLVAAVRSHAESHLGPLGCRVVFDGRGVPDSLPPTIETAVFRIVQEAVNNIAKHAGACNARIGLRCTAHGLEGDIEDDGCGLPEAPVQAREPGYAGLGLQGMRERASQLGGTLSILPIEGGGTRVKFNVPLPTGSEE